MPPKKEVIDLDRLSPSDRATLTLLCEAQLDLSERMSELNIQLKELDVEKSTIAGQIDSLCERLGLSAARILGEGWYTYLKAGGSHIDRVKLLQNGVTTEQIAAATVKHKSSRIVARFGDESQRDTSDGHGD